MSFDAWLTTDPQPLDGPAPDNECCMCLELDSKGLLNGDGSYFCRSCARRHGLRIGPKRAWLERARDAGERCYHQNTRDRSEMLPHEARELVYQDWLESIEWTRPSAFAQCKRAAKFMRAEFVAGFDDEQYVSTTN